MNEALAAKMAELSARFSARAADDSGAIAEALAADDRATLADIAHKLAGNAGMFGHHAIGEAALALEEAAESGAEVAAPAARLRHLLAAL